MAPPVEEVLIPYPNGAARHLVPVATQFRSTWLTSSLRAIRDRKLLERYLTHLPREHHDAVLNIVVGVWLPTDVATAHYMACDKLGLSSFDIFDIGSEVGKYAQGSVMSVAVQLAKGAGVTPWTVLVRLPDLWKRIWIGGGVAVYKHGPKEARLEIAGFPASSTTYCRVALRGVVTGLVSLFCTKTYVKEIPQLCGPLTLAYRVSWA